MKTAFVYAIIHVGSTSMSMSIVKYHSIEEIFTMESASREVTLGEEVFKTNRLSFQSTREMCMLLTGFKELMKAYGVEEYKAYATSAIREAENRRNVLDQIYVQTGLKFEVVDMPNEVYYKYFALFHKAKNLGLLEEKEAALFLDITSGGLGITVYGDSKLQYQKNLHIGTLRVFESFTRNQRASDNFTQAMEEFMYSMLAPILEELNHFKIQYLILSGDEASHIAELMGYSTMEGNLIFSPEEFKVFYKNLQGVTPTKLINKFHLREYQASVLMPMMMVYHAIIELVEPQKICILDTVFREGLIFHYGAKKEGAAYLREMEEQNIELAKAIASKFHYDIEFSNKTEEFGLAIMSVIKKWGGIKERSFFLFKLASILIGTGKYINLRNHSKQSYDIVMGTDIFGLSEVEKQVIANVVYYYYKGNPSDRDDNFSRMTENRRMQTVKMVAIMRLAAVLDASHQQKITALDVTLEEQQLQLVAHTDQDITLERWSVEREAALFAEVFGLEVVLNQRR